MTDAGPDAPASDNSLPDLLKQIPVNEAITTFLKALNSIRQAYYQVMPNTARWLRKEIDRNVSRMQKFQKHADADGDMYVFKSAHEAAEMLGVRHDLNNLSAMHILQTVERSLFTQIFCEFDAFMGALLSAIYKGKAELLKSISREMNFSELLAFESLEAVKLNMLEKEIENFRRDSYVDQFSALEKKFNFKTLREFNEWAEFVELGQRRNLLIHNGGRVSEQYLLVCEREGCKFDPKPELGSVLGARSDYFSRAIIVVSKVGFMLGHTLWKKVFPDQWELQTNAINETIYSVLEQQRWRMAAELSAFGLAETMRKNVAELDLRLRIINGAIGLKFSERDAAAYSLLDSYDWTASLRDFRLATLVLRDDFADAASLMVEIGKRGELVDELAYHRWPLFHKFRQSEEFQNAYHQVYGVSFAKKMADEASASVSGDNVGILNIQDQVTDSVPKTKARKPRSPKKGST